VIVEAARVFRDRGIREFGVRRPGARLNGARRHGIRRPGVLWRPGVLRLGGVVALVLAVVAAITLRHVPAQGDSKDRVDDANTALTKETTG
jgi:hypothetical protein